MGTGAAIAAEGCGYTVQSLSLTSSFAHTHTHTPPKHAGVYRLCFANIHEPSATKRITVAVHVGTVPPPDAASKTGHAKVEHVLSLTDMVKGLDAQLDDLTSEQRYYLARMHRNHYTQVRTCGSGS